MRRVAIGLAVSLALLPVASARAARSSEFDAQLTGQLTYTWHGDPALGCAAAGVCDVSGSLIYPAPDASLEVFDTRGRLVPGELELESVFNGGVIRVSRGGPEGDPGVCVDTVNPDVLLFTPTPAERGHYVYDVETGLDAPGFSSGRCAGPVEHDLQDVMPSGRLALGRRGLSLDMTTTRSFRAGAFSGEMVSTLKGRLARPRFGFVSEGKGITFTDRSHGKKVTLLELVLAYRLKSAGGELTTSFSGLAPPLCDLLDACGTTGTLRYNLLPTKGVLHVVGTRVFHGGRLAGKSEALRELRTGRLRVAADAFLADDALARVSEVSARPGDEPCNDSENVGAAPLDVARRGNQLVLRLGPPRYSQHDAFRTRCGGPAQADVVGNHSLAVGPVSRRELGGRHLQIELGATGPFSGDGYAGSRSGRLTLGYVLSAVRVMKIRVPVGR